MNKPPGLNELVKKSIVLLYRQEQRFKEVAAKKGGMTLSFLLRELFDRYLDQYLAASDGSLPEAVIPIINPKLAELFQSTAERLGMTAGGLFELMLQEHLAEYSRQADAKHTFIDDLHDKLGQ